MIGEKTTLRQLIEDDLKNHFKEILDKLIENSRMYGLLTAPIFNSITIEHINKMEVYRARYFGAMLVNYPARAISIADVDLKDEDAVKALLDEYGDIDVYSIDLDVVRLQVPLTDDLFVFRVILCEDETEKRVFPDGCPHCKYCKHCGYETDLADI